MTTIKRPLYQMLVDPSAAMLDAFLRETKKLDAQVNINRNHTDSCYPELFIQTTKRCLESSMTIYKVGVLLVWIVLNPSIRDYFASGENPKKFNIWFTMLSVNYDNYIMGLRNDGSKYEDIDYLKVANTPYFVHRMIEFYSDM